MKSKNTYMLFVLPFLTFFVVSSLILPAGAVTTMTLGKYGSVTTSSVASGSSTSGNIFSAQGPTGHFWNVITGAATNSAGTTTEPMYYNITLSDSSSTAKYFAACGSAVNYWGVTGTYTWWCNDSGYAAGDITCAYNVTNEDSVSRVYMFSCNAYYE